MMLLLADGFEEVEAITPIDLLRRAGIQVTMISIMDQLQVNGGHHISVIADCLLEDIPEPSAYDGVVLPGGKRGQENLSADKRVLTLLKQFQANGKLIAAICAGPLVLSTAGIVDGKKVTVFPGLEDEMEGAIYTGELLVRDGNIITAVGLAVSQEFSYAIIEYLVGENKKKAVQESTLFSLLERK